jgi:hypothetical protein
MTKTIEIKFEEDNTEISIEGKIVCLGKVVKVDFSKKYFPAQKLYLEYSDSKNLQEDWNNLQKLSKIIDPLSFGTLSPCKETLKERKETRYFIETRGEYKIILSPEPSFK